jgi:uncharacterized protein YqjF (DUF2071 family)
MPARRFLTAEWRNLAMLNYEVAPSLVAAYVPAGCELDSWDGRTFVSVVGFQFLSTRVLGIPIPFHRDFEEVNLRFYVRRRHEGSWRRGVVFIKELVPRHAIAWVARQVYGENYVALPMRHSIRGLGSGSAMASYEWRRSGAWEGMRVNVSGSPALPEEESEASFITEHYWGYTRQRNGGTVEYQVEHPRWRVWHATGAWLKCNARALYGAAFSEVLSGSPRTAFLADGSAVTVRQGQRLGQTGGTGRAEVVGPGDAQR